MPNITTAVFIFHARGLGHQPPGAHTHLGYWNVGPK